MTTTTDPIDVIARAAVDAIFADLRDRRFLKWLFDPAGEQNFIGMLEGQPLTGLDLDVQDEIASTWRGHILTALTASGLSIVPVASGDVGEGFVFWNPDSGEEYSPNHPVESGECEDAERIRSSTEQEDTLWNAMQSEFARAEAAEAALSPAPAVDEKQGEGR